MAGIEERASLEKQLCDEVLNSVEFSKGHQRRSLFKHLYERRPNAVTAEELMRVLGINSEATGADKRLTTAISEVRKHLKDVAERSDSAVNWILPEGLAAVGYSLRLSEAPTEVFWKAHMVMRIRPMLIYCEPTFFYDIKTGAYIRYLDVNPPVDNHRGAIEALVRAHGEDLQKQYPGNSLEERLRPTHIFVGMGEVDAMEYLYQYFFKRFSVFLKRKSSDAADNTEIAGAPILLGARNTNHVIDRYLHSEEAAAFDYRIHPTALKCVAIRHPGKKEIEGLRKYEIHEEGETIRVGNPATLDQTRYRLALLQRMPIPGTKRAATMIMSEATLGIRQVALAVTEDKQAKQLVHQLMDDEGNLPATFEALFSVRIAPTGKQHEAGDAELISVRVPKVKSQK